MELPSHYSSLHTNKCGIRIAKRKKWGIRNVHSRKLKVVFLLEEVMAYLRPQRLVGASQVQWKNL